MGLLGSQLGSVVGGAIGSNLGKKIGYEKAGQEVGTLLGRAGGLALPYFKKGGEVRKTGIAMVHKGEYVLPKNIKPTKSQKMKVNKMKKMMM